MILFTSILTSCGYLQLVVAVNNLNQEKVEKTKHIDENKVLKVALEDKIKEIEEMSKNLEDYK